MEKLKSKRTINLLIFVCFFSFFTVGFSQLMLIYSVAINLLLTNTFLEPILNFLSGFLTLLFKLINYAGIITLIISLITLFIIFYEDFIKGSSFYKF